MVPRGTPRSLNCGMSLIWTGLLTVLPFWLTVSVVENAAVAPAVASILVGAAIMIAPLLLSTLIGVCDCPPNATVNGFVGSNPDSCTVIGVKAVGLVGEIDMILSWGLGPGDGVGLGAGELLPPPHDDNTVEAAAPAA
jgi:hypothetical protein